MDQADLGTLDRDGETIKLTFTRRFAHPPEKVWRAVTEPEHLAAWFPDRVVGEFRAGAALRFENAHGDGFDGKMLEFEPPRVMEILWGTDRLRFELAPDGNGTLLTFTDTFAELGKAARDGAGWHECLDRLANDLDGVPQGKWGDHWRELYAGYVEHLGPEASTIGPPEGWEPEA
jgi:uncharacterized protein YndB with AHSA1/START domain